ncbi:MAG: general secretion pathway protein L [Lentisphaeria bacterium]
MTERMFVRRIHTDHWQWRLLDDDNRWQSEHCITGDLQELVAALPSPNTPLCLIVPGHQVVVERLSIGNKEKGHLAKLLPYEMEDDIVDPIDDMHFCFRTLADGKVGVAYARSATLKIVLDELLEHNCDVQQIFPDYTLLYRDENQITLLLDGNSLLAQFGSTQGFTIEEDIAAVILAKSLKDRVLPAEIKIISADAPGIASIKAMLPESCYQGTVASALEDGSGFDIDSDLGSTSEELSEPADIVQEPPLPDMPCLIKEEFGNFWDSIDPQKTLTALNLRSGILSRQLPFGRWWLNWKFPAYIAASAFCLAFVVMFIAYLSAKEEGQQLRQQIEHVYLSAAPNGRKGDEERRLESLLKGSDGKVSRSTNLVELLGGLSLSLAEQSDIKLSNFRYNGDQRELQVNIEVKGLGELGQFRDLLSKKGLDSGSPRTSLQGEIYQANMKITEKTL